MKTIGVVIALFEEAVVFIEGLVDVQRDRLGPWTLYKGRLGEKAVVLIVSGEGSRSAGAATRKLIEAVRPDIVINAGFSGGLAKKYKTGAIVCSTRIVSEEKDRIQFPTPPGFALPPKAKMGVLLTTRRFIHSVAHKRELNRRLGAVAVDMESLGVAFAARQMEISFLAVRVISDDLSMELPMMAGFFTKDGRIRPLGLLCYFLRHPFTLAPFIRFMLGLKRHAETLALALKEVILSL